MRKVVLSLFLVCLSFTSFACGSEEMSRHIKHDGSRTLSYTAPTSTTPPIFQHLGPYSFSQAERQDLKFRCDEVLERLDCYKMVLAAYREPSLTKGRDCSFEEVKTWIEQEEYLTNFWLFIETNCGPIAPQN